MTEQPSVSDNKPRYNATQTSKTAAAFRKWIPVIQDQDLPEDVHMAARGQLLDLTANIRNYYVMRHYKRYAAPYFDYDPLKISLEECQDAADEGIAAVFQSFRPEYLDRDDAEVVKRFRALCPIRIKEFLLRKIEVSHGCTRYETLMLLYLVKKQTRPAVNP